MNRFGTFFSFVALPFVALGPILQRRAILPRPVIKAARLPQDALGSASGTEERSAKIRLAVQALARRRTAI